MAFERLANYCRSNGFPLESEQIEAFSVFEDALYRENEVHNLTRIPKEECEVRHFLDSLLIAPLIPEGSRVLDLGTGPGFPSVPLALARPDLQIVAVESSGKMLSFLRTNAPPNLAVVNQRAEDVAEREAFDVVTGRAVAPLAIQLEISAAWAKVGGYVIPFRTAQELKDLRPKAAGELGLKLQSVREFELEPGGPVRAFPMYLKQRATPKQFPRSWAQIRKRPL